MAVRCVTEGEDSVNLLIGPANGTGATKVDHVRMTGGAAKYTGKRPTKALNAKIQQMRSQEREEREQKEREQVQAEERALRRSYIIIS